MCPQSHPERVALVVSLTEFVSMSEAAAALAVSERTIRRRVKDGTLPSVRLGRLVRIPASGLPSAGSTR